MPSLEVENIKIVCHGREKRSRHRGKFQICFFEPFSYYKRYKFIGQGQNIFMRWPSFYLYTYSSHPMRWNCNLLMSFLCYVANTAVIWKCLVLSKPPCFAAAWVAFLHGYELWVGPWPVDTSCCLGKVENWAVNINIWCI